MSLQAYQQAATRAETPRETEYRLFAQVTLALMEAAKCEPADMRGRIDALDWNRRGFGLPVHEVRMWRRVARLPVRCGQSQ